jgi:hypothetical protein
MTIRCSCGNSLVSIEAICELCDGTWGLGTRRPYPSATYRCHECGDKAPKPEPDEMPLCDDCYHAAHSDQPTMRKVVR